MTREIGYSREALKTLDRIPRTTRDLIREKVRQYAADPASLANNVKRMQGFTDRYRLRVGDWRVIFDANGNVLFVVRIASRGGAYQRG